MKLATKLGLGAVILGILANVSGRDLSKYYSNQREVADAVLGNTILKKNSRGKELDAAIYNLEKCEGNRNYANGFRDMSYIMFALGGLVLVGQKIKINPYIE